jgi:hypothetical protein
MDPRKWSWVAVGIGALILGGFVLADHNGAARAGKHPQASTSMTTRPSTGDPKITAPFFVDGSFGVDGDATKRQATYHSTLTNISGSTVEATNVSVNVRGLELVDARVAPAVLPAKGQAQVFLTVVAPDCAKVDKGERPVRVTFTVNGQPHTQDLELTGYTPDQPWQLAAVDAVCSP